MRSLFVLAAILAGCQATTRAGAPQADSETETCTATPTPTLAMPSDPCAACLTRLRAAAAGNCHAVDPSRVTLFQVGSDCSLRGPDVTYSDGVSAPAGPLAVSCPCSCASVYAK